VNPMVTSRHLHGPFKLSEGSSGHGGPLLTSSRSPFDGRAVQGVKCSQMHGRSEDVIHELSKVRCYERARATGRARPLAM
jgi:hypothetical protein